MAGAPVGGAAAGRLQGQAAQGDEAVGVDRLGQAVDMGPGHAGEDVGEGGRAVHAVDVPRRIGGRAVFIDHGHGPLVGGAVGRVIGGLSQALVEIARQVAARRLRGRPLHAGGVVLHVVDHDLAQGVPGDGDGLGGGIDRRVRGLLVAQHRHLVQVQVGSKAVVGLQAVVPEGLDADGGDRLARGQDAGQVAHRLVQGEAGLAVPVQLAVAQVVLGGDDGVGLRPAPAVVGGQADAGLFQLAQVVVVGGAVVAVGVSKGQVDRTKVVGSEVVAVGMHGTAVIQGVVQVHVHVGDLPFLGSREGLVGGVGPAVRVHTGHFGVGRVAGPGQLQVLCLVAGGGAVIDDGGLGVVRRHSRQQAGQQRRAKQRRQRSADGLFHVHGVPPCLIRSGPPDGLSRPEGNGSKGISRRRCGHRRSGRSPAECSCQDPRQS